jgi:light-independent protochlorophyllide reductase B subunit
MQLYKFLPPASDRMGALWTLSTIKDAAVLEYGPAGTTHYGIEGFAQLNADMHARLFTTHMDETDIVMGDSARLETTIREVDEVYRPPVIFVLASSISSIIGTDLETICSALQPATRAKLIPVTGGGWRGDLTVGIREVLTLLAKEVVKPETDKLPAACNIIGVNIDCYNFQSDLRELRQLLKSSFGLEVNTVFTADSSLREIERATAASFNLVLRAEGLECAEVLRHKYGMPFLYGAPYGYQGTLQWLERVGELVGQGPDAEMTQRLREQGTKHCLYVRRALFQYHKPSCLLAGNFDQVQGLYTLLSGELGLEIVGLCVNHRRPPEMPELDSGLARTMRFNISEGEKLRLLAETRPTMVFGDGVLLGMAKDVPVKVQVANPNLTSTLLYDGTPFMGINGATYIIERMLQGLRTRQPA